MMKKSDVANMPEPAEVRSINYDFDGTMRFRFKDGHAEDIIFDATQGMTLGAYLDAYRDAGVPTFKPAY